MLIHGIPEMVLSVELGAARLNRLPIVAQLDIPPADPQIQW